jgi:hypothetical protein
MKIIQSHLVYYKQRKVKSPNWANALQETKISIHSLINFQTYGKFLSDENHNTLGILKFAIRKNRLKQKLEYLIKVSDGRRKANCIKWLERI